MGPLLQVAPSSPQRPQNPAALDTAGFCYAWRASASVSLAREASRRTPLTARLPGSRGQSYTPGEASQGSGANGARTVARRGTARPRACREVQHARGRS